MLLEVAFISGSTPDDIKASGLVTKVYDGDTPTVNRSVRMLGIDAPELKQDPWGQLAQDFLKNKVLGKVVILQKNSTGKDIDKYGRLLRWVILDGEIINLSLVKKGLATTYMLQKLDYKYLLEHNVTYAKAHKLGIWSDPNFIDPSEWRKR